jgi:hypothetical protein
MKLEIATRGDALRHTSRRAVIAVCSTVVLTLLLTALNSALIPSGGA